MLENDSLYQLSPNNFDEVLMKIERIQALSVPGLTSCQPPRFLCLALNPGLRGLMTVLSHSFSMYTDIGGFQLLDLIIPELKSHMIPYKFKCSHWLKLQHSDWRANLVKDSF